MSRRIAILLSFTLMVPIAHAQFDFDSLGGGGNSLMGSMCPYERRMSPNAFNIKDLMERMEKRKKEREEGATKRVKDLSKDIKELDKKIRAAQSKLKAIFQPDVANIIITHLEKGTEAGGDLVVCPRSFPEEGPPANPPASAPAQPEKPAVPSGSEPDGAPVPRKGPDSDNRAISVNRMPAAESASAPVATKQQANDAAAQIQSKKDKDAHDAAALLARGCYRNAGEVDCDTASDGSGGFAGSGGGGGISSPGFCHYPDLHLWDQWALDGDVDPAACETHYAYVHRANTFDTKHIDACKEALVSLREDYQDLRDARDELDEAKEKVKDIAKKKRKDKDTEADYDDGLEKKQGIGSFLNEEMSLMRMAMNARNYDMRRPPGYGGWPLAAPFAGANYQAYIRSMGMNNGVYGGIDGGIGAGGFGCNNMDQLNRLMHPYNPRWNAPMQWPFGATQAGAPFNTVPPHAHVLPYPGQTLGGTINPLGGLINGQSAVGAGGYPSVLPVPSAGLGVLGAGTVPTGYGGTAAPTYINPSTGLSTSISQTGFYGSGVGLGSSIYGGVSIPGVTYPTAVAAPVGSAGRTTAPTVLGTYP